jgi:hypothetical protein
MDFRTIFVNVCMFFLLISLIAVIVLLTIEGSDAESKKKMNQAAAWLGLISGVLWTALTYAFFMGKIEHYIPFIIIQIGFTFFAVAFGITAGILELTGKNNNAGPLNPA